MIQRTPALTRPPLGVLPSHLEVPMRARLLFIICVGVTAVAEDERGYLGFQPSFVAKPAKGIAIQYVWNR